MPTFVNGFSAAGVGVKVLAALSTIIALAAAAAIAIGALTLASSPDDGVQERDAAEGEYRAAIASYDPSEMNRMTPSYVTNGDNSYNFIRQTSSIVATGDNSTILTESDYLVSSRDYSNNNRTVFGFAVSDVKPSPFYWNMPPLTRVHTYPATCELNNGCTSYYMDWYACPHGSYTGNSSYCGKGPCGSCTVDQYLSELCIVVKPSTPSTPSPSTTQSPSGSPAPSSQSPQPSTFPTQQSTFPTQSSTFPARSSTFPAQSSTFPARSSTFPAQSSTFPSSTWTYPPSSTWMPSTTPSPSSGPSNGTDHYNLTLSRRFVATADPAFEVDGSYLSCQYPFTVDSNVYSTFTSSSSSMTVRLRTTNDPFIVMQRLTKGTQSFDVYVGTATDKYFISHSLAWPVIGGGAGALIIAVGVWVWIYITVTSSSARKLNQGSAYSRQEDQIPTQQPQEKTCQAGETHHSPQSAQNYSVNIPSASVYVLPPPPPGYVVYYLPSPVVPQQQQLYYSVS